MNLRITFQSKLVLAMLAILLAVQIATLGLVLTTTRASVNEELRGQLGVGANVFQQMLEKFTGETDEPTAHILSKELGELYPYYQQLRDMKNMRNVQARLPYVIEFR